MVGRSSQGITARIDVGGHEVISHVFDAWQRLYDKTSCVPFYSPQWITTYVQVFEPHGKVVLLTAWAAGELVAALPLIQKREWFAGVPLRTLSGAANVHSVRFDIVRSDGPAGDAAIRAMWNLLKRTSGWQIIQFPTFPAGASCEKLIQCASEDKFRTLISKRHDGPVLRMEHDSNSRLTWLAGTSRHFRHELRRHARLLDSQLGCKAELVRWTKPGPEIVRRFYALEAAGWKGRIGSAIDCTPETRTFYDRISRETAEQGCFCLHSLELNHRMVAGAFSVMTHCCFFPLKIAYDETLHRVAPGHLLFNAILEECAERGIPELYFGGNSERFKTAWTSETLPHFNGFIFNHDSLAQFAYQLRGNLLTKLGGIRKRIF